MNIQSNINRMISLAAVLSRMPGRTSIAETSSGTPGSAKAKTAFKNLQERQDSIRNSNNIVDTIKNEPTSLGNFKDLNPKLQQQILSAMEAEKKGTNNGK